MSEAENAPPILENRPLPPPEHPIVAPTPPMMAPPDMQKPSMQKPLVPHPPHPPVLSRKSSGYYAPRHKSFLEVILKRLRLPTREDVYDNRMRNGGMKPHHGMPHPQPIVEDMTRQEHHHQQQQQIQQQQEIHHQQHQQNHHIQQQYIQNQQQQQQQIQQLHHQLALSQFMPYNFQMHQQQQQQQEQNLMMLMMMAQQQQQPQHALLQQQQQLLLLQQQQQQQQQQLAQLQQYGYPQSENYSYYNQPQFRQQLSRSRSFHY